jgi:predicted DNA-binding antitoxin AbrB/MazE fold protein
MVVQAKYEAGVFKPVTRVDLPEGTVVEVSVPGEEPRRRSVREFDFCGMWKDREDIPDGVTYVNRLRERDGA